MIVSRRTRKGAEARGGNAKCAPRTSAPPRILCETCIKNL
jgi:hypothetical protein